MSPLIGSSYVGIVDRIITAADRPTGVRFVGPSVAPTSGESFVPWREIHDEARVVGAALQARGLVPGDHVAILGPTSRQLITIIQGCWLAGIASMVLPLPMRMGSLDAFIDSTRARIRHGDAKLVLIDELLAAFYDRTVGDPPIELMASVLPGSSTAPGGERLELPAHDPERLVILQYTSGSTSEPKGRDDPRPGAGRQHRRLVRPRRARRKRGDGVVAAAVPRHGVGRVLVATDDEWLPACAGRAAGLPRQARQLDAVDQRLARHATAGPNFSWVLATRALSRMHDLDLSSLTLALSGAEPVDPKAVEAFVEAAAPFGFKAGSVFPAFGMAEVAIGGVFPPRHRGMVCDSVDRVVLERDRIAKPLDLADAEEELDVRRHPACSARAVPGLEMQVVDPDTRASSPNDTSASCFFGARR